MSLDPLDAPPGCRAVLVGTGGSPSCTVCAFARDRCGAVRCISERRNDKCDVYFVRDPRYMLHEALVRAGLV